MVFDSPATFPSRRMRSRAAVSPNSVRSQKSLLTLAAVVSCTEGESSYGSGWIPPKNVVKNLGDALSRKDCCARLYGRDTSVSMCMMITGLAFWPNGLLNGKRMPSKTSADLIRGSRQHGLYTRP